MAKVEVRGYFHEIGEVTEVGEKKTKLQKVIFMVFGYQDRTRGIMDEDEPWVLDVLGKTVDELKLGMKDIGATAKVTVYIKGFMIAATSTQKAFSGYRVNLGKVEIINLAA
jgi:hypothetical protein